MKIPFSIGKLKFIIEPYNTAQEKQCLLTSAFDLETADDVFKILNFETDYNLSEDEKKVILFKHRECSIGDEIDTTFKCKCGQGNDGQLMLTDFVIPAELDTEGVLHCNEHLTSENLFEYISEDFEYNDLDLSDGIEEGLDDLDIEDFDEVMKIVQKNQVSYNFIKQVQCMKCMEFNNINVGSMEYIIQILSEESLMTLYKSYNFLVYFGKYSLLDIDSMLPFERAIYIGLLNKVKEDLSK